MYQHIKDRAKEIYRSNTQILLMVMAIYTAIEYMTGILSGNIIFTIIASFITAALSASKAYFWFRTYNRDTPDYTDMYSIFLDKTHQNTILTIMTIRFLIDAVLGVVTTVLAFIPVLNIVAVIAVAAVGLLLSIVWYLFAANPYYSAGDCFRASWEYMKSKVIEYIIFVLSVAIVPALFCGLIGAFISMLLPFLGSIITTVLFAVFEVYISLATAGYVSELIPQEWYRGTAVFEK
ncbi:MAG: hypothetical protein IJ410_00275 [Oscillospiraceae bacterium]|nr:hypothetical protein [Oscillospiraceae bacterium]